MTATRTPVRRILGGARSGEESHRARQGGDRRGSHPPRQAAEGPEGSSPISGKVFSFFDLAIGCALNQPRKYHDKVMAQRETATWKTIFASYATGPTPCRREKSLSRASAALVP